MSCQARHDQVTRPVFHETVLLAVTTFLSRYRVLLYSVKSKKTWPPYKTSLSWDCSACSNNLSVMIQGVLYSVMSNKAGPRFKTCLSRDRSACSNKLSVMIQAVALFCHVKQGMTMLQDRLSWDWVANICQSSYSIWHKITRSDCHESRLSAVRNSVERYFMC